MSLAVHASFANETSPELTPEITMLCLLRSSRSTWEPVQSRSERPDRGRAQSPGQAADPRAMGGRTPRIRGLGAGAPRPTPGHRPADPADPHPVIAREGEGQGRKSREVLLHPKLQAALIAATSYGAVGGGPWSTFHGRRPDGGSSWRHVGTHTLTEQLRPSPAAERDTPELPQPVAGTRQHPDDACLPGVGAGPCLQPGVGALVGAGPCGHHHKPKVAEFGANSATGHTR